jgi:hypothetical protein
VLFRSSSGFVTGTNLGMELRNPESKEGTYFSFFGLKPWLRTEMARYKEREEWKDVVPIPQVSQTVIGARLNEYFRQLCFQYFMQRNGREESLSEVRILRDVTCTSVLQMHPLARIWKRERLCIFIPRGTSPHHLWYLAAVFLFFSMHDYHKSHACMHACKNTGIHLCMMNWDSYAPPSHAAINLNDPLHHTRTWMFN